MEVIIAGILGSLIFFGGVIFVWVMAADDAKTRKEIKQKDEEFLKDIRGYVKRREER